MCGGVVAVGVLVHLCVASATHEVDQTQTKSAARAPSTPVSAVPQDPVLGIELSIQQSFLKDGKLVPPTTQASPQELKAYDLILEAKRVGADDLQAIHQAAEQIWQDKKSEHERRVNDRSTQSRERAELSRKRQQEKMARKFADDPPPSRAGLSPKPPKPDLGPAYIPDPQEPPPFPGQRQ